MRCQACNDNLSDFESTRKSRITGEYLDLCSSCYATIAEDMCDIEENEELIEQGEDE